MKIASPSVTAGRVCLALALSAGVLTQGAAQAAPRLQWVKGPVQGYGLGPEISRTGRFVVWAETTGDSFTGAVYLLDRSTNRSELISVDRRGRPAFVAPRTSLGVSDDGRYVVFESSSKDIVEADKNGVADVFLRDRKTKRTRRLTAGARNMETKAGGNEPLISADGATVFFSSCGDGTGNVCAVYALRWATNELALVASGLDRSDRFSIDADGRTVAFETDEPLVRDDSDSAQDIYVKSLVSGKLLFSSKGLSDGVTYSAPTLDGRGANVAFIAEGVGDGIGDDVVVRSLTTPKPPIHIHGGRGYNVGRAVITGDGKSVVYAGGHGSLADPASAQPRPGGHTVFRYSIESGKTEWLLAAPATHCEALTCPVDAVFENSGRNGLAVSHDGSVMAFETKMSFDAKDTKYSFDVYVRAE